MNQEELTRLKEDFRDWLSHPLTELFIKIMEAKGLEYKNEAQHLVYNEYYKKEISETAICLFGKSDGIDTMLSILKDCKADSADIDFLFNQYFESINESN